jgi:hypothetical protein
MSDRHVFEIEFAGSHARTGKVTMDGCELRGVTGLEIRAEAHDAVSLTLTFIPDKARIRLVDPEVEAKIKTLFADVTDMGATNCLFTRAEAV